MQEGGTYIIVLSFRYLPALLDPGKVHHRFRLERLPGQDPSCFDGVGICPNNAAELAEFKQEEISTENLSIVYCSLIIHVLHMHTSLPDF